MNNQMSISSFSLKKTFILFFLFIIGISMPSTSFAQSGDDEMWKIETKDGNRYLGEITKRTKEVIVIKTKNLGEVTINKDDIESMDKVDPDRIIGDDYWGAYTHTARYFWAPNAFNLKKGEGYYQNSWIFLNQVSYGLTDNFSIGAGMVPLFLFNGTPSPFWITPKVSFPIVEDKFSLGGGALIATVLGGDLDNGFAGIAYGVGTIGNPDANLTIGLGYGFAGGDWANSPTISLSGMIRINQKTYFMSENYFIGTAGSSGLLSFIGARTAWENVSLDYGLLTPFSSLDDGVFIAIPWLSLAVPFGNK